MLILLIVLLLFFGCLSLPVGIALGLAVLVIPVVEIVKACQRAHARRKKQL